MAHSTMANFGVGGGQPMEIVHDNRTVFAPDAPADPDHPIALLVLNNPTGLHPGYFRALWDKAIFKISADGASNWIFDQFKGSVVPDVLNGDLDSIRPQVADYFRGKGSQVIPDKCQESSDIMKCLSKIRNLPNSSQLTVVIAGVFGGRFDHEMGNLNVAFRDQKYFHRMLLLSAETFGEILLPNIRHRIFPDMAREGPICGMIPLFGACERVDTNGLRWNMEGRGTSFGGLVSTSNEVAASEVEILADAPLLWTTTFQFEKSAQ